MKEFTCTENNLKFTHTITGEFFNLKKGDVVDLPDNMVADFCELGWGTCPDFTTKDRTPGFKVLDPNNSQVLYKKPVSDEDAFPFMHTERTKEKIEKINKI